MDRFSLQSPGNPDHRRLVLQVLNASLTAVDPQQAIKRSIVLEGNNVQVAGRSYDLESVRRILVCGAGKASIPMAVGLDEVLANRIDGGAIISKTLAKGSLPVPGKIEVLTGSHPSPDQDSLTGTQAMLQALSALEEDDLVFCLISGGGSALMVDPADHVSLEDLQALTKTLLACGASITEINTLRKHLDRIKGGGLLKRLQPALVVSLVLSDVVGSDLATIASGPTVPDPTTYLDAFGILMKYGIVEQVPDSIVTTIRMGIQGDLPETLKPKNYPHQRAQAAVIGSNFQAANAAVKEAAAAGYHSMLLTTYLQGEARYAGEFLASIACEVAFSGHPLPRPACLVAGGETTVTLHGGGRGGRNQEAALGAVRGMAGLKNMCLVSLATDGEDGPTDAAGAVVTGETLDRANQAGLNPAEYLTRNDAYAFFDALDDLVRIGPTGTNVNDLAFLFAFPEE